MAKEYYFISDLHIGGDEALGVCDFENELIHFLDTISTQSENAELIIIGDAFGLWEFTQVVGKEKVETLFAQFSKIFDAFQKAGEKITITILPGNHDYELACYSEFVEMFEVYNICVEQTPSIIRKIGGKSLWIEHGNQYDPTNYMPDFGNPHAMPIGYFITSNVVGKAGLISKHGRYNWLKDIQSVYPTELIPDWIMSNYFYREMSPILRWILLPFLLFSGLTFFVLGGALLEYFNITESNIFLKNRLFNTLGIVGNLFEVILTVNAIALLIFLILAIPVGFIYRDLKRTMKRFDVEIDPEKLAGSKNNSYQEEAVKIFENNPDVIAFIYGHTHTPSIKHIGNHVVINTGTWLKQFERITPRFGLLPAIYVPNYTLNYFSIKTENEDIVINYQKIDKEAPIDLSLVERIMAGKKRKKTRVVIPSITKINQ